MPSRRRSPSRLSLREAVETPDKTAALVTPDRALARRVLAALERWNVPVDDSGGDALADTPAGVFARLAAEAALGGLAPVPLLALLKHPLLRLGARGRRASRAVAALERAVLRGPAARSAGTPDWRMRLRPSAPSARRSTASDPRRLHRPTARSPPPRSWSQALGDALAPLAMPAERACRSPTLAARHRDCVDRARRATPTSSTPPSPATTARRWRRRSTKHRHAGRRRARASAPATMPSCSTPRIADRKVRRAERKGVRVRIFGPLEARLQTVDRMVLGGLDEGVLAAGHAQRSLAQSARCGTSSASICRSGASASSAHDFAQALGAPEVDPHPRGQARRRADGGLALRAAARGAVAGEERWAQALQRGDAISRWRARSTRRPASRNRSTRPEPSPPLAARPDKLVGHRDRELAARSLHDLRQARARSASARSGRHAARRRRPRQRDPRGDRRVHRAVRRRAARRSGAAN